MSKKIFIVYGHHNVKDSFNASIRDTFIDEAKTLGHEIDLINLHEEKPIPFLMVQNQVNKFLIIEKGWSNAMYCL